MTQPMECANPDCCRAARVGDLCSACYQYERRTGHWRPEEVIVASGYRQLMRDLERTARPTH
jgi:hypothetical protein